MKNNNINISIVSSESGISRKTFYNNKLLKMYVEYYSTDTEEKNVPESEFERIKLRNEELTKQIHKLVLRDIETENLRHQILELNKEIENLQIRNNYLEEELEKTQDELIDTKNLLGSMNVIPFSK